MHLPIYKEIPFIEPIELFVNVANEYGAIFLDSALKDKALGRFSYIALDPFEIVESRSGLVKGDKNNSSNPFAHLSSLLKDYQLSSHPHLPPFQGGMAGFFGYELHQHLEKISLASVDDMQFPDMMVGLYDCVAAFDHIENKAFLFSSGLPETASASRLQRAQQRLAWFELYLLQKRSSNQTFNPLDKNQFSSFFTQDTYCEAVQKCVDYILAGDIFEVNLSQRFTAEIPLNYSTIKLYQRLRDMNPASFAAYLNFSPTKIISASPERFLQLKDGMVETRPIKGTCARGKNKAEDENNAQALLVSEKDRAENIMIVDLMRNDLSRVCEASTVRVPQLCGLESFATVHHLVSVVQGKLKDELTAVDLLRASFPGGSITGAPKIRAMEIIAELEPTLRGPYCGSIGFISWSGDMDTSITIRTILSNGNKISYQVGGAIVADSNPVDEYEETLMKANALRQALTDK